MGTLCLSGAAAFKAGAKMSGAALVEADYEDAILQAEGVVCAATRHDWITNWGTISGAAGAKIVEDATSSLAAIPLITHAMEGYTTRVEAEDIINVLRDGALRNLSILRDKKVQDFIDNA